MKRTQDDLALARVQAAIAAGLIVIGEQLNLLSEVDPSDNAFSRERRDLWALELEQARLCRERSATLRRIATNDSGSVVLVV